MKPTRVLKVARSARLIEGQSLRRTVDVRDRDDLAKWCRRLGVTPLQLCSVVDRVGSDPAAIEIALRSRKRAA